LFSGENRQKRDTKRKKKKKETSREEYNLEQLHTTINYGVERILLWRRNMTKEMHTRKSNLFCKKEKKEGRQMDENALFAS
jgi:hypothetical protein